MATIKEIAKKAGVSIGTVDRVLHDRGMVNAQTKERILAAVEELHYKPNHAAQGLAVRKKQLKLAFLIPDVKYHPFFQDILDAAKKKAKELRQYDVRVFFYELDEDPFAYQGDENLIREQLQEVDGIALPGADSKQISAYMKYVRERDLPVVFYNGCLEEYEYLAYVGCDYVGSGRLAAGLSALAGSPEAKICIYSELIGPNQEAETEQTFFPEDVTGIPSHDERLRGFREEIKNRYPKMEILTSRKIQKSLIDNFLSAQEMIREFPDVNIVYVINPADYGICEAIYKADTEHRIRIITNDLVEEQAEMIRQGMISATVCQEPERQGAQPLEILFRYLAYGELPKEKMQYTDLSIHIVQNIQ